MAGKAHPDPAHEVLVAEGAEGLKVPGQGGSAADHRRPDIKVRGTGSERCVAPGTPVALPLEGGRPGLIREVRSRGDRLCRMRRFLSSAHDDHAGRCPPGG